MGEPALSEALRELHELHLAYECYPSEERVHQALLRQAPPERTTPIADVTAARSFRGKSAAPQTAMSRPVWGG